MRISIQRATDIRTGYQVRQALQPDPAGTHLVIQTKDIDGDNDHRLIVDNLDRITPGHDASSQIVNNGDILFLSRGKRRFATLVEGLPLFPHTIALSYFFILRPNSRILNPVFLTWVINETEIQEELARAASGTTVPFVTKQSFGALEVEVPPLDKQDQIGRLYQLACRERLLIRKLERQRSEYLHSVSCMLYEQARAR